jgi:hypothetical protein
MAAPAPNCKQPGGAKHVPSAVPIPGTGPTDASARVGAHKGVNESPTTVGTNPNKPTRRMASDNNVLTSGTPAAGGAPTAFPPYQGNY